MQKIFAATPLVISLPVCKSQTLRQEINIDFYIIDSISPPVILGAPFLRENCLLLDITQNKLFSNELSLYCKSNCMSKFPDASSCKKFCHQYRTYLYQHPGHQQWKSYPQ